eukprot:gnl/TRDRNA2_/TRDRNA2_80039_c0_seq1.p1 gnl/TRDRNA2_/TRDRNA2_80039_c0~~gnl/TRDRNA2_/TRDRNA2_80039_c0_seq1.p1  ORF type:complete len:285 (+),score=11.23 gnl/TRDRNA2_/TRDRNA2_80039_c0_seq1:121-975(+)
MLSSIWYALLWSHAVVALALRFPLFSTSFTGESSLPFPSIKSARGAQQSWFMEASWTWIARRGKCERAWMQSEIRSAIQTPPAFLNLSNVSSKASIALLIIGRIIDKPRIELIRSNIIEAVDEHRVDAFLNLGTGREGWEDGEIGPERHRNDVELAVKLLRPKVWSLNSLDIPSNVHLCKGEQTNNTCTADDASEYVGCYKHKGNQKLCSRCDSLKYFQQFGRLFLTYVYAKEYEAMHSHQYLYFVRLRTDLYGSPIMQVPFPAWSHWLKFDQGKIYMNGNQAN